MPTPEDPTAISDPRAIRALAHPTRLALLEILAGEKQATATRCAELSGQSVASCSFHLRSLAKHGFLEAVAGPGREKPWRVTSTSQRLRRDASDPESVAASGAFDQFFLGHEFDRLRAWWAGAARAEAEADWREASVMTGATAWLTLAELEEVGAELHDVVQRHFVARLGGGAARPADPPGTRRRPVRLFLGSSVGLYQPAAETVEG